MKENYEKATEAPQERLDPAEREALVSAQKPCSQSEGAPGTHCLRMCEVSMVTCILPVTRHALIIPE